ncbi:hypothetical protein MtrunA17_Chr5g0413151 [Medicago truncatula]|uniref:Uncharacterized protein n=1 Tax=Medicago truncatula TaxID=3880 RepID=A0A396HNS7_MEDTR|nr:hypothetical protein MtrunA17_Chr5g0413151 [Medicago truncatula]
MILLVDIYAIVFEHCSRCISLYSHMDVYKISKVRFRSVVIH